MFKKLSVAFSLVLAASLAFSVHANEVKTIEWTDLMPEDDLQALMAMPEVAHDYSQPSPFEENYNGEDPAAQAWQQILQSAKVKPEFNNVKIKIPGFIVPLEFDADQNVTSFFLVPYFGACIHVPPPPPNQIIYVSGASNLRADMIYSPFWIIGTITTESMSHDLANAAYSMKADKVEEYTW
ncbi:DUF3299 domain-containing protein [Alishewanella sp. 16-MA]|uniref:DUF3299 domain-containing protein n=1 Tax=Alishewanella maricola TaxID=2795740 RepID=A0ABS8C578_9ALTE|nr:MULTISPECIES: DUF3299 domain-containing protein [Alishewanella]MDP4944793.1 DUF3299 domain-containing protein [Alishewanella sp.]MDP5206028.1 DUF3299 domain-containing protein [Alishewanella sp. SMS9]MCB5227105.1 DUF3299 domain-containing protein [Alishewanella maricola]MDP5036368.1 DUF3299 domain-containing protein [Alishewanella sp.]MDP5187014.1 DUF3299 domain-containing protein [Alishewanella sp.]